MDADKLDPIAIGLAVQQLRNNKDLSAKDLSLLSGLPSYTVSRIETGKLKLDFITAMQLSTVLKVSLDEIARLAANFMTPELSAKKQQLNEVRKQIKSLKTNLIDQAKNNFLKKVD